MMPKILIRTLLFFLTVLFFEPSAFAASTVLFDFNDIHSQSPKRVKASDIEAYMEELFGADVSISQKTTAVNSYLTIGKGKGAPAITIDFGENPVDSFAVDFQLFKRAKRFAILADGVLINQQTLSKPQRKTGLAGHLTYFFDTPVQTLQFVGINKKSFAIDNLVINLPLDEDGVILGSGQTGFGQTADAPPFIENSLGDETISPNQLNSVPEPSSLLMLVVGLCGALLSRRVLARQ
jgi:PEP-CTERM motif